LPYGGRHMAFSAYSLPLQLAIKAQPWDGDVIAEDHHCYIKNRFFALHTTAEMIMKEQGNLSCQHPSLEMYPVFLPVKSTSVINAESYWQSWTDRWYQGTRHARGVSELSYSLLAMYDAFWSIPTRVWSFRLWAQIIKQPFRMFCVHVLPIVQSISLGAITLYWLWCDKKIPKCASGPRLAETDTDALLCGLAGGYTLIVPMAVPFFLVWLGNLLFICIVFVNEASMPSKVRSRVCGTYSMAK